MKNFILGLFSAFLVLLIVYLIMSNSSLKSRIDTLTQTYAEKENTDVQKFKEDYYLKQLDRDTNLLLVVFPILLAITTIATFAGVREEFKRNLAEVKSDSEKQISEYNKSVVHISNLKSSVSFQYADRINKDFGSVLLERPLDTPKLIELGLLACQNYCYTISYSSNDTQELKASVLHYVVPILDVMVEKVNSADTVKLKSMSYEMFLVIKNSFDLVLDKDNLQKFSIIFSKVSFPTY
jgi:hypothetical protein